jgi:spore germination protein GerM
MTTNDTGPVAPAPKPGAPTLRSRRGLWAAIVGGAGALAIGVWLVAANLPRFLSSPVDRQPAATPGAPEAPADPARRIHATLFYVADNGAELVPASREVPYGATPAEQARHILEAQVQAPPDGVASAIPPETKVRDVFLTDTGEAFVDFGPEISTAHHGGSLDEALAVYAIVNAVTVNLPDVTCVRILVDGKEVDTLAGQLDLRRPLTRSLAWVRKGQ